MFNARFFGYPPGIPGFKDLKLINNFMNYFKLANRIALCCLHDNSGYLVKYLDPVLNPWTRSKLIHLTFKHPQNEIKLPTTFAG